jgi:hypothetical protein
MLAGCKADMICPAYQSYFILDEMTEKSQFAYFALDSLPRRDVFNTSKNQNGMVVNTGLLAYVSDDWQRNLDIKTIPMEVVYPEISDSLLFSGDALMFAETDVIDSAALDSARFAGQTFQYNVDQKYYNWYFKDKLVWKDELNKKDDSSNSSEDNLAPKKGFFGFLKGLFKKKEKTPLQDQETAQETEIPKEKTSLFKKKEKKDKPPKQQKVKSKKQKKEDLIIEEVPKPPVKEEEDDGEDDF